MMGSTNADFICYDNNNEEPIEEEELCQVTSFQENVEEEEHGDALRKDTEDPLLLEYETTPHITCRQNFADCSNVFKAFIGSAMVGLPFATSQTGIGFALIGVFMVALLTDHCCILIIKCKKMIIANIINKRRKRGKNDAVLREEAMDLGRDLTFGRVGKVCLGTPGVILINTALMITQLGFTIGYFIFLGNTMRSIFKYFLTKDQHEFHSINKNSTINLNLTSGNASDTTSILHHLNSKFILPTPHFLNSSIGFVSLLLVPLPMLILIAFVRNLRKLAPVSVIANASLAAAFGATSLYMILKMNSITDHVLWFKLGTFPILFGQVTAGFEGIGTVIPIESSMAENKEKYPNFLHVSVTGLSLILSSFGIIGYLAFGNETCQIITGNLTGPISILLQILLFIGVLFTYPLQIYPCIQITELVVLKMRQWKETKNVTYEYIRRGSDDDEGEQLMSHVSKDTPLKNVKLKQWESNLIRTSLVVFTAAIALIFRFQFAYIASLTGSIGSSLLSYIIPALCHIHLTGGNRWLKVKDVFLIIFGIVGGVSGVIVTIKELIESFNSSHPLHC